MATSKREHHDSASSETLRERVHDRTDAIHEKAAQPTTVHGHSMQMGDVFKFVGLIAFFVIMGLLVYLLWPYFHELFEPGGLDRVIDDVRAAGPVGFLILLGLQFIQIVVAFIRKRPGHEDMTEQSVREWAIPRIARYKVPKRVFFVDDFPMTPSMKVQKFKLREMAAELVGASKPAQ